MVVQPTCKLRLIKMDGNLLVRHLLKASLNEVMLLVKSSC